MAHLTWTTAGESHGPALVAVLSGLPAGMPFDLERVQGELARRQQGYGRGGRMRIETDRATLLSGTRAGRTLGSPLALQIPNRDAVIERLPVPSDPRPGHADLAGCQKLGEADPRAVLERASARETAARVALGGAARQVLEHFGVELFAHVVELGGVRVREAVVEAAFALATEERLARRAASDFHALDPEADAAMRAAVDAAKADGDTLGGVFEVRVLGLPPGLGSYADPAERLTARLGGGLFSIPAIKGVEFGLGFEVARRPGSEVQDAIVPARVASSVPSSATSGTGSGAWGRFARRTNRAGGLEGGLTTGEPLIVRVAMKPIPTLKQGIDTVAFGSGETVRATYQRSDVTSVPAAGVVGESVVALELARAFLAKFGGDSLRDVEGAFEGWRERVRDL